MSDDDWKARVAAATAAVENALSVAISSLNDSMVVKWVAAFEYITPDGERQVASMASSGLMKWDVQGLLSYVLKNDDLDSLRQLIQSGDEGA